MIEALKLAFVMVVLPWAAWVIVTNVPENTWEWYCENLY